MPTESPMFGTENTRSVSAPVRTLGGLIERWAAAGPATRRAQATEIASRPTPCLQAKVPGDHHALNLIRPLADLQDLLVAVQARDWVLVHETVAAVNLETPVRRPVRKLPGEELRHRGGAAEVASFVLFPGGLVDEATGRLDLRGHVDELLLHRLELGD